MKYLCFCIRVLGMYICKVKLKGLKITSLIAYYEQYALVHWTSTHFPMHTPCNACKLVIGLLMVAADRHC